MHQVVHGAHTSAVSTNKPLIKHNRLQDVNSPDFDLERDLKAETLLGMETGEITETRFRIDLSTIIISALVFLAILAWFDALQTAFYSWLYPPSESADVPPYVKLWYAIFVTLFIFALIFIIYNYLGDYIK
jgi:hypothetical protein